MNLRPVFRAVVLAIGSISAQQPATEPASRPGLVVGRAVDGTTGRPLSGVTVSLTSVPAPGASSVPAQANSQRVLTGTDGVFVFGGVGKGSYNISATRSSYVNGAYGKRSAATVGTQGEPLQLAEGERRGGLTIALWKYASIGGRVADETGEPLIGIQVRVLRRTIAGGRWQLSQTGNMPSTDDRGVYRVTSLLPGDYVAAVVSTQATVPTAIVDAYVQAATSGDIADLRFALSRMSGGLRVGPLMLQAGPQGPGTGTTETPAVAPLREPGPILVYPTVFYPAGSTVLQAAAITVAAGEDRGNVDFQLKPVPSVRVSGTVTAPDGPARNTSLQLLPAGIEAVARDYSFEAATSVTNAAGEFTFLGVTPGQYTIKVISPPARPATSSDATTVVQVGSSTIYSSIAPAVGPPIPADPTLWGTLPVAVAASDVEGIVVALRPGGRITGHVEFDGTATKPTAIQLRQMTVTIDPSDGRSTGSVSATVQLRQGQIDDEGRLNTYQLPAGKYVIRVPAPAGWTFAGAFLDGKDISHFPVELTGSDVSGVVVKFTDRAPELSGTVRDGKGVGDGAATVLIFPVDTRGWMDYGSTPRLLRSVATQRDGSYKVPAVAEGDFWVAAVRDEVVPTWQDPAVLKRLSGVATRVTIGAAEKKMQDLVVRDLR